MYLINALGFAKISGINDPKALEIIERQKTQGFRFNWSQLVNLGARLRDGGEVVYDDDGPYFRVPEKAGDLVLIRLRE